jgi:hypothetical protein
MVLALVLAAAVCQSGRGPLDGLPGSAREGVGPVEALSPCAVASLPPPVRAALAGTLGETDLSMADPGGPWNSTCVPTSPLPRRQLVFAGHSGAAWVVHFWDGGFVPAYRVAVVRVQADRGRVTWSGSCWSPQGPEAKGDAWLCRPVP